MKKLKFIRQTTMTECGICCLAMVTSYYKYVKPIAYYRDNFSIGRDGTSIKEMYDIFNSNGMDVDVYKCQRLELFDFEQGVPYIIFCKNNHFITIQVSGKKVYVSDPANCQSKVTLSGIEEIYSGIIICAKPNMSFVQEDENISDFRYIKKIIQENVGLLSLTLLLSIITYVTTIIVPVLLQQLIDETTILEQGGFKTLLIKIFGIFVVFLVVSFIRNRINIILETNMLNKVSKETMYHLFRIPYSFFDNRSSGNILYRLGIVDHLRDTISTSFIGIIMDATCVLSVMCYIGLSFPFLIIPMVISFFIIGIYIILVGKHSVKLQREELEANEKLNELETDIVTNIFQIKCLRLESYFWESFKKLFNISKKKFKNEKTFSTDMSMIYALISVFTPMFFTIGAMYKSQFQLSNGRILLIYSLTGMLMNYTSEFFNQIITLYEMKAHVFYLNDMLDETEVCKDGNQTIDRFENLEMKNISFSYTMKADNIVDNFSMQVKRGEKVAIVGITGSGKTTLVKLMAGLYSPSFGNIIINDIDFMEISEESMEKMVTIVPQMPIVFNKNIRDNISLGDEKISDNEVIFSLEKACLLQDVMEMPMGINTYISGQGGNLSGGQIQRLALARAIVRKPQLLVLDEATSSLDAKTENAIFNNIKQLGLTTIIISHRLSTIRDADCIYYIEKGNGIVSGTHEELYKNNSSYCDLFKQQFLGVK